MLPPGQHDIGGSFPVLTAGPTPRTDTAVWDFSLQGAVAAPARWTWDEFARLPHEDITVDLHCVTSWSKFGTRWSGVAVDTLLAAAAPQAQYVTAFSDGGYTTNLAVDDLTGGRAWVVDAYEGGPLPQQHGGPARLLVPHLYLWKSAKWCRGLTVTRTDEPGFWERYGYHSHGDPWLQQRYDGD
jgi:DMSO/TMAO reductase YedYZ molybdopterin-dependent catalytic subunit